MDIKLRYASNGTYGLNLVYRHNEKVTLSVAVENEGEKRVIGFIHYQQTATMRSYDLNKEKPTKFAAKLRKLKEIIDTINKDDSELREKFQRKGVVEMEGFELDVFLGSLGIAC